jgi:uncharacterized protein YkwD
MKLRLTPRQLTAGALLFCGGFAACRPFRTPSVPPRYPTEVVRHGLDRLAIPYDDPQRHVKENLFARINRDRAEAGLPPVAYEPRAALVGDHFCLDAAMAGTVGHWDLQGRTPYLRWALAGGLDYHSQNTASYSFSSGSVDRPLADLLLEAHEIFMAERPPRDGHRRAVLDPTNTHVGIGMAVVGGEFRMSEEFTSVALPWIELPAKPLRAGEWASFASGVPDVLEVESIELRHEPEPRALKRGDLVNRGAYRYPRLVRRYDPHLPAGLVYRGGGRGDFEVKRGRVFLGFPLSEGPGHYFVLAYVRRAATTGPLWPVTAAMITALP